jgi:hypothetical protein
MTNKQQTAVEWLSEQFDSIVELYPSQFERVNRAIEQAKEMEKERKKHAYDWGETNGADECNGDGATHENFEQYYQETYGGNK